VRVAEEHHRRALARRRRSLHAQQAIDPQLFHGERPHARPHAPLSGRHARGHARRHVRLHHGRRARGEVHDEHARAAHHLAVRGVRLVLARDVELDVEIPRLVRVVRVVHARPHHPAQRHERVQHPRLRVHLHRRHDQVLRRVAL